MDDTLAVNVFESIADTESDPDRTLSARLDLPKDLPFRPFHDDADAAHVAVRNNLGHARVVQFPANFRLTLEAAEERRITFHLEMRNLDGNRAARAQVRGTVDRGHGSAHG